MSGAQSSAAGLLSRRNFLKTGAVAAGGVWAGSMLGCAPKQEGGGEPQQQVEEQVFNSCCRPNCFNCCMLDVHVREGKVVKTSAAEQPIPEFKRICLRGLSHVQNVYHSDRVLHPLRRVGERGAGEWEEISWDEAISEIAEKFTKYREEFGDSSIIRCSGSGNYGAINNAYTNKFFNQINASTMSSSLDMGNFYGISRVFGMAGLWPGNDPRDLVNAKTIFLWGNNITDAQIHDWHFLADAKEAGAYIVCIDPIFTQAAAKSDMFVPIRPGSDTALEMAMMYVILEEGLQDDEFILSHTVAPFLVKDGDGKFLRMSDLGVEPVEGDVDPATGEPTVIDPYVVWDFNANDGVELSQATSPAVEGEYTVNGIACHTAFTLLKNEIMQYPPEKATELCEVPVETIRELARLACDGPVTHRCGWGAQAYDNGIHPYHAGATMAALAGQLGFPGANYQTANWTYFSAMNPTLDAVETKVTSPSIPNMVMADVIASGEYAGAPITPKALWVWVANPMCTWVDTNSLRDDVLKKLDFIVTVDNMMTDTARWSDIVLPCAHWFEYEDIVVQGNYYSLVHSEKVIEPLGEAKPDSEIMKMLASKMGLGDDFFPNESDWLREYLNTEANNEAGLTYDNLCEKNAIRYMPDPFLLWQGGNFLTPSGRVEFYIENPTPYGVTGKTPDLERERLPHFFEPREAWPTNELHKTYPFVLMSERPRYRVHGQWAYNPILREIDPEPTVKMNPADAKERGLSDGDHVDCFNDHGHAVARLVLSEAIRTGTLVYPKSWQADQHLAGGWSEPLSRECDPVAVNQSFMDCLVDVRLWEGAGE